VALNPVPIQLGVIGYGVGGRYFHIPFVETAAGVLLSVFHNRRWDATPVA
jgi:hypothetical protein